MALCRCLIHTPLYRPIFLAVQEHSATEVREWLILGSVAIAVSAMAFGILVRITGRCYKIAVFSQIIYLASMIATFNLSSPPYVYFFFADIRYGAILTASALALLASVQQKHQAVATSTMFAFRSTETILEILLASFDSSKHS
jgi:hypothetical protein